MPTDQLSLPANYQSLTQKQRKFVREEYIRLQNNLCWHCKCSLDKPSPGYIRALPINWNLFPPGFTRWPHHLHHSHETGLTIGTVHSYCNAVLWQYHGK